MKRISSLFACIRALQLRTASLGAAVFLTGCADPLEPTKQKDVWLDVTRASSAPYQSDTTLPGVAVSLMKFGANGHTVTQAPYIEAVPDGIGRTFEALRGLGGTTYRFEVPLMVGDQVAVWTQRTQQTLQAAASGGWRVVVVLSSHPNPSLSVGGATELGYGYASTVIGLIQPYLSVIDAVELGNEMEVQTPGMFLSTGVPGTDFSGTDSAHYNAQIVNTAVAYYRGMRQAFLDAGGAVAAIPRLSSATSGHTWWINKSMRNISVTRYGQDGIAWHWYTTGTGGYAYLTSDYSGKGSVIGQLRAWYGNNGFRLWVTETNSEYPRQVFGLCPSDNQVGIVASRIGPLLQSHASLPEVEGILAYEIFDENTTDTTAKSRESRYGFAVSGCAAVGNQIGYKTSADSLAMAIFRLRDSRKILAAATILGLGGAGTVTPADTSSLPSTVLLSTARGALVNAMESSITRSRWLTNLYSTVHRRAPDPSGFAYWLGQLSEPGWDRHRVESEFYASDEYFIVNGNSLDSFVWALYRDVHGRQNDPDGVAYWVWRIQTGTSRFEVARSFLASSEHIDVVVTSVHSLVLDRAATEEELTYWRPRLFISQTLENMVFTLILSNETIQANAKRRLLTHRQ